MQRGFILPRRRYRLRLCNEYGIPMILHKNMINDASYSFHSNRFWKIRVLHRLSIVLLFTTGMSAQTYICGGAAARSSVRQVIAKNSVYSLTAAGFDLGTAPEHIDASGCTSSKTFFFSVPLPEGNYTVSMVLGGAASSVTTVRAEARRLMLARIGRTLQIRELYCEHSPA